MTLAQALIQGRIAQAQGNFTAAIEHFQEAAAIQDRLPYMEPPYWPNPVRQTLAAALLQAGRVPEAEEQFVRALNRAPANGWSYYGLSQVHKARGDTAAAAQAEAELAKTWMGDRGILQVGSL
jgi:tetratricopeptide (TPR) repeat protein